MKAFFSLYPGVRGINKKPYLVLDPFIGSDLFEACIQEIWKLVDTVDLEPGYYQPSFASSNQETSTYKTFRLRNSLSWYDKHKESQCSWHPVIENMPRLKRFIESLPLKEIGRIKVFYNQAAQATPFHRDHNDCYKKSIHEVQHRHEFIWMSSHADRKLYLCNERMDEKIRMNGRFVFFNEVDLHGSPPFPHPNFSLRVDGQFSDNLREELDIDRLNCY